MAEQDNSSVKVTGICNDVVERGKFGIDGAARVPAMEAQIDTYKSPSRPMAVPGMGPRNPAQGGL